MIIIIMNNRQQWINHGIKKDASYMIIACNGESCDDYPVYCYSKEEVENKLLTEFNFFNLDLKTHHGVIDLNKHKENHMIEQKSHTIKQVKNNNNKKDGKVRKYRHMQLRTLNS